MATFSEKVFSASVIPVVPCTAADLIAVRNAVVSAVHYLEGLTKLRYYPVTTYVIDQETLANIQPTDREEDVPSDDYREGDIYKLMELLSHLCRHFHNTRHTKRRTHLTVASYERMEQVAQSICFNLSSWIDARRGEVSDSVLQQMFFPELSLEQKDKTPNGRLVEYIHDDIREIIYTLKDEPKFEYGGNIDSYLHVIERRLPRLYPVFRGALSRNEECLAKVYGCLPEVMELFFRLVRQHQLAKSKHFHVVKLFRLFGCYLAPGKDKLERLISKMRAEMFPEREHLADNGAVILCLDGCKSAVNGTVPTEDFLTSIMVHEHAHAISTEGFDADGGRAAILNPETPYGKKRALVNESLAEWAEINYWRDNPLMSKVIADHAASGEFPEWPYAGGVLVEKLYNAGKLFEYRTLLGYYRNNSPKAYKLLTSVSE